MPETDANGLNASTNATAAVPAAGARPDPTPAPSTPAPPATAGDTAKAADPQDVGSLPQWAQDLIHGVRAEAADARTRGKAAADEARTDLTRSIGNALGLIEDGKAPTVDDLTEQVAAARQAATDAARELAIFRAGVSLHVDAAALTDSRSFMAAVSEIDPTDTEAVEAAIQDHVKLHPRYAPQAGASSTDHTGQAPGTVTPRTLADAVRAAYNN